MRYRLGLLLLVTVLVTACQDILPPAGPASPHPPPATATPRAQLRWGGEDTFSIVYLESKLMEDGRSYDPYLNLYVATLSGGERRQITFFRGRDVAQGIFEFDVSRDGKAVAFKGATETGKGIYLMGIDGGRRTKLLESDTRWLAPGLSWSPDSQRIAFLQFQDNRPGPPKLGRVPVIPHSINADGSGLTAVGAPVYGGSFVWSPDGKHLAYVAASPLGGPPPPKMFIASLAGGEPRLLHNELLLLAWSPDGRKMLWHDRRRLSKSLPSSGATNRSMLWVSGPDGADMKSLTVEEDWVGNPAWGPDSRSVAYTLPVPAPAMTLDHYSRQLWLVDVETGERRLVATFPWRDLGRLEWTRDGKAIYILVKREFEIVYDLWAVPSAGGDPMKIKDSVYDFRLLPGSPA